MGKSNMSRRYRQRIGLLSLGVLGLMGLSASNFRGNEPPAVTAGAPSRPAVPGPLASQPAQAPAFLGVAAAFPRHRYIVQAQSADAARAAVSRAGGVVSTDLSIIRAVAAALDEREMSTLRAQNVPQLHIYDDSAVVASSMGTLPETYYPSEVDAANLHLGGMTGRGVTVAVIDSGLWSNQGPLQSAPGESRSRIIAQYDVILARQNPRYYLPSILESYSRNITDALWLSADAFYNLGGETSIDGIDQDNMANTLRIGAGMGLRLWRGADMGLNYERVVAKPASEPYSQTVRLTVRQLW